MPQIREYGNSGRRDTKATSFSEVIRRSFI